MANKIQQIRREARVTQGELAERINADPNSGITNADASMISKIELGKVRLSDKYLAPIARALGVTQAQILGEEPATTPTISPRVLQAIRETQMTGVQETAGQPIAVYGTAAGSVLGTLTMTTEVVEWVTRPMALAGKKDIYALYVVGSSMEPRYFAGDIVFIDPHRPPRQGDDVIIQTRDHTSGGTQASIKRYERRTENAIVTSQFNPPSTVEFRLDNVKAIHRILTRNEVAGV